MPDKNWIDQNMTQDDWDYADKLHAMKTLLEVTMAQVTEFKLSDGTILDSLNAIEDDLDTVKKMIRDFDGIVEQRIRDRQSASAFDRADMRRSERLECAA
ncbi:hypothetical protein IFJ82_09860 [Novacetimonas hansenii]|uniref:hypothetical protein n=1 Tax=Novacetimonas hansenii TaxID=436 RepID=UPI00177D8EC1|nr:hypothetical protein [Novacetimonas hansenii]QOF94256.1 hypothetical protein IFJ82_09860 [Novacetimonas hansenii]